MRDLDESKKRVADDPTCVVKKRVSVKWRIKQRRYPYRYVSKYFEGTVKSYDAVKATHFVVFDDGDEKHYKLSTQDFKILPDPVEDSTSTTELGSNDDTDTMDATPKTTPESNTDPNDGGSADRASDS